ncbi:HD domain-containing phosphohydrolase [Enterobacter sp. kpr-6]|uniref:HD domain-containing phosphohydrolase n=1 Tax=Enterobacter sp. kpr-6 TaxID=1761782 RepID=UPI000B89F337|nr:HD domain-containing phosphohydrolase [Enterobacter sp. kpr-6]
MTISLKRVGDVVKVRCQIPLTILLFCSVVSTFLLWSGGLLAANNPQQESIPVWVYDADSFEFWRDAKGEYRGLYPQIINALNDKYGYKLQLQPVQGADISKRFNHDSHGLYVGVIRTETRARTKVLSSRLFDNEVVAASLNSSASRPEDLNQTRVIFRQNDATWERIHQRYPDLTFRQLRMVTTSEEAFRILSEDQADYYVNDATEMDTTARYYQISHPFKALRLATVIGFSPDLRGMRDNVNQLINEWQRNGKMQNALSENRRQYLLSRITLSDEEKQWLAHHILHIWLPKNENFAPLIWQDKNGYHGSALDLINDLRELLQARIEVHYIDDYVEYLRRERWPVRLIDISTTDDDPHAQGNIGPKIAWHNLYYTRIGQPFLWDEEQIRHQRVGVLAGSFAYHYLRQRFDSEVTVVTVASIDRLIDAIEDHQVDYILGDLSSLETSLRGNELFRGVLKVAGITRPTFNIGPWVEATHPLHNLLSQFHRLSSYRTQLERQAEPVVTPGLTKNTLKIISVILLITALFSLCLLGMMWRHIRQNRHINRNIVEALEKVNRAHDNETGSHIQRVAKYCDLMARELRLPRKITRDIRHFASLHDVGKIAVPERILRKEGPLTPEEYNEMKLHTVKGWRIIQGLGLGTVAENIIHFHHEKWDGSGYPEGLRGERIPLEARILAIADVYDALRQKRVYKPGFSHEHAYDLIVNGSGQHFDPRLVALFRQHHENFRIIYDSLAD